MSTPEGVRPPLPEKQGQEESFSTSPVAFAGMIHDYYDGLAGVYEQMGMPFEATLFSTGVAELGEITRDIQRLEQQIKNPQSTPPQKPLGK